MVLLPNYLLADILFKYKFHIYLISYELQVTQSNWTLIIGWDTTNMMESFIQTIT